MIDGVLKLLPLVCHWQTGCVWGASCASQWRRVGEAHRSRTWKDKLALSCPRCGVWLSVWCDAWLGGSMVCCWMMENELLLSSDDLSVRGGCSCRLWGHQDGAGGRDGWSETGCVHGWHGWHGHVGVVGSSQSMVRPSGMKGHHAFTVHQLLHGKLVGLLRSSPFCPPVLEPNLQKGREENFKGGSFINLVYTIPITYW